MATYYVYVVTCADGTLYVGSTTDPDRRVSEHNRGVGSRYTRGRLPTKLSYVERLGSRSSAQRREAELKRLTRAQKILLIDGSLS